MDNQNMARILQNMIEEAEENLARDARDMEGHEALVNITKRRADVDEAVKLIEELNTPAPAEQGEGLGFKFGWFSRRKYNDLVFYVEATEGMNVALFERPDTEENRAIMSALLASRPQPEAKDVRELDRPTEAITYLLNRANSIGEVNALEVCQYVRRLEARLALARDDIENEVRQECANRRQLERCILVGGSLTSARSQIVEECRAATLGMTKQECLIAKDAALDKVKGLASAREQGEATVDAKRCAVLVWRSNEHPGGMDWIDTAGGVIEDFAKRYAERRGEEMREALELAESSANEAEDCLSRQIARVADVVKICDEQTARADLLQKQLTHLLNMVNRVTCNYRHRHGVKAIAYQDMDMLCDAQIEIEDKFGSAALATPAEVTTREGEK